MASVFAVVSKKIFESEARVGGKVLGLGGVWKTDTYKSTHAALDPLGTGGHLFLVTVRPPSEALWLIAVLRDVKAVKGGGWKSAPNTTAITDISSLKGKIKFATGSGITAAKGKLGMSLQTPRTLTDADVAVLLGGAPAGASGSAAPAMPDAERIYHLNGHEKGPLPCLCKKCLATSGERVVVDGEAFVRREARAKDRVLYFWLPEAILGSEKAVLSTVRQRMQRELPDVIIHSGKKKKKSRDEEEDDE